MARLPDPELIHNATRAKIVGLTIGDALHGLRVMRNLAVHEPEKVAPRMAKEFLRLADAVEESLDRDLRGDTAEDLPTEPVNRPPHSDDP